MSPPIKTREHMAPPEKTLPEIRLEGRPVLRLPPLDYRPGVVTQSERPLKTSTLGVAAPIYENTFK